MFVSKKLKMFRERQGLTQKRLAELSGISISTITKLESGVLKNPSVGMIACMSIVLHVNCSDLQVNEMSEPNPFSMIDDDALHRLESKGYTPETWQPYNSNSFSTSFKAQINEITEKVGTMNDTGVKKVIDYTNDLIASGRYTGKK